MTTGAIRRAKLQSNRQSSKRRKEIEVCNLRSSDTGLLYRPRTSSDFESYCFTSAAPTVWNSLSVTTRTANRIGTFRSRLKTDLFTKAYAA